MPVKTLPTAQTYEELQTAFDRFNAALFDGKLPPCLLTLQREKLTCGYFSKERFASLDGARLTHEIALNPSYFAVVPLVEVMQTLVHEMTHLWQCEFGQPARGRYHNAQWADKMESIGLMPSSTGQVGGKRVGEKIADYPIRGGRFLQVCEELFSDLFKISWYDRYPPEGVKEMAEYVYSASNDLGIGAAGAIPQLAPGERERLVRAYSDNPKPSKPTRVKYSCACGHSVWGKPKLLIECQECESLFEICD